MNANEFGQELFTAVAGLDATVTRLGRIIEKVVSKAKLEAAVAAIDQEDRERAAQVQVQDPRVDELQREVASLRGELSTAADRIAQQVIGAIQAAPQPVPGALDMGEEEGE